MSSIYSLVIGKQLCLTMFRNDFKDDSTMFIIISLNYFFFECAVKVTCFKQGKSCTAYFVANY